MTRTRQLGSLATMLLAFAVPVYAGSDGWTVVPSANSDAQDSLQSVSGIASSELWAVGVQFNSSYNDSRWQSIGTV